LASISIAQFFFIATDDKRIIVVVIEMRQLVLQWPRFFKKKLPVFGSV